MKDGSLLSTIQYNAVPTITGLTRGSSRNKMCQELGLERLHQGRYMRRLYFLCKVLSTNQPLTTLTNLTYLLPPIRKSFRHPNTFNTFP